MEDGECSSVYSKAVNLSHTQELAKRLEQVEKSESSRDADILHYTKILRDLVEEVTQDYQEQVMQAAAEGKRHVEIYSFPGDAKFQDTQHSILFLTKGPRRHGQDFFLRLGILPFLAQVWQVVRPFETEMRYDPEGNENNIILRW